MKRKYVAYCTMHDGSLGFAAFDSEHKDGSLKNKLDAECQIENLQLIHWVMSEKKFKKEYGNEVAI